MKRRYLQYDKLTGEFNKSPELDEQDLLEAPDHIIYFRTNEERDAFRRQSQTVHPVTPVETVLKENMNTKEETEVKTESTVEVSVEKTEWGGKRNGAGTKKGYQQSQEHRDRRIAALRESAQRRREERSKGLIVP